MKKDNILSIVVMGCGLLLALSVFLPFVSYYGQSVSLWKAESASRFIYILLGLLVIVVYLINKKTSMSYLAAGYGLFNMIEYLMTNEGLEGTAIAFYLILLSSLAIVVITFMYDETKADALIGFNKKENPQPVNNGVNNVGQVQQMNIEQPVQQVIQTEPVMPTVEPVEQVEPVNNYQEQKPVSFDPNTGAPIYSNQNNN